MKEIVSINGQIFEPARARISVFDRGFLYGDGVYEVTRSYGRVFFALEEHIKRLFQSADRIGLEIGMRPKDLENEIYRVYGHADCDDAYMRIVVTRGEGPISLDPGAAGKPNTVIFIKKVEPLAAHFYESGIDIMTAKVLRNSKSALDPNIKSGNYLNNILALREAKKKGVFDALLVNREGFVTEGTTWNIFMVKAGKIITPPDDADILHGITRQILRLIARREGLSMDDRFFTVDELQNADEVFSTGSVKEILAIRSVDDRKIGSGVPGPVTKKIAAAYKKYVQEYCANFAPRG